MNSVSRQAIPEIYNTFSKEIGPNRATAEVLENLV